MNEKLKQYIEKVKTFWTKRSNTQKIAFIGSVVIIVLIICIPLFWIQPSYVSLYNDLTLKEASQIKAELDTRNISYEIKNGGTSIYVPKDKAATLLVDLAGQGIPDSGSIDYSFFSENASWGVTDSEFNMMKLDATQTELSNLISNINGIQHADVMLNLPEDPVFASDVKQEASASIVLTLEPGYNLQSNELDALKLLAQQAIPNLPQENIYILDQNFNTLGNRVNSIGNGDEYTYQQTVKKNIEKDIKQQLERMIAAMLGSNNVIVSVTSDVDFSRVNTVEELVKPVDIETMEGLPVSIETIHETYRGDEDVEGIAGNGEGDIVQYPAGENDGNGDYELIKEKINNEYNRVRNEIVGSPYKIRDLGIQVAINNVKDNDNDEKVLFTQQEQNTVKEGISSILGSMISTTIDTEYEDENQDDNISIVFQEFTQKSENPNIKPTSGISIWWYILGGLAILLLIFLLVMLLRRKQNVEETVYEETYQGERNIPTEIPDLEPEPDSEADIQQKQLEKMAKDNPDDFAKLLRSWMSDD